MKGLRFDPGGHPRRVRWATGLALALVMGAFGSELAARPAWAPKAKPAPAQAGRTTPSGLPVPRYVSLKFATVNARRGPGDDYPLLWVYHAKDLPVQIVAETEDWRRICDPEGGLAWVHRRTVDARRTVMRVQREPLPMRRKPDDDSAAGPALAGRAIADLKTCQAGWCKISVGRTSGWVPTGEVWGAQDAPQCAGGKPRS